MTDTHYTGWLQREFRANAWGKLIYLPAGTQLRRVASGQYAVSSIPLLISLTGNDHDPKYRFLFVPLDLVVFTTDDVEKAVL